MIGRNYFHPLKKLERKRNHYIDTVHAPDFLQQAVGGLAPQIGEDAADHSYICLDLETTGVNAETDKVLSIGWVEINNMHVELSSSRELFINSDAKNIKAETAVINHITPEMLEIGCSLDEAMQQFFVHAKGKVIVAHGCCIEQAFIDKYFQRAFSLSPVPLVWLDTLAIEKHISRFSQSSSEVDYRLSSVRQQYGLPEYNNHGALIDALATAELLLAQMKKIFRSDKTCFSRLFRISESKKN